MIHETTFPIPKQYSHNQRIYLGNQNRKEKLVIARALKP